MWEERGDKDTPELWGEANTTAGKGTPEIDFCPILSAPLLTRDFI